MKFYTTASLEFSNSRFTDNTDDVKWDQHDDNILADLITSSIEFEDLFNKMVNMYLEHRGKVAV